MAIAEAKMLNKPSVVTKFDVAYDQINNNKNGVLVEMSPNSIANGIKKVMNTNFKNIIIDNLTVEKLGSEKEINKIYELIEKWVFIWRKYET